MNTLEDYHLHPISRFDYKYLRIPERALLFISPLKVEYQPPTNRARTNEFIPKGAFFLYTEGFPRVYFVTTMSESWTGSNFTSLF